MTTPYYIWFQGKRIDLSLAFPWTMGELMDLARHGVLALMPTMEATSYMVWFTLSKVDRSIGQKDIEAVTAEEFIIILNHINICYERNKKKISKSDEQYIKKNLGDLHDRTD
ncbi:MAG: hypothetical protein Q8O19_02235 [Rectinemataceae bacterium]|nr:hypothetical protein [Rectinemataceae bacterium]